MTFNQTRPFFFGFLLFTSASIFADTAPKSNWDGTKASAGLSITTGNANNSNINGEFDINYAQGDWKNITVISGQYGKNNGTLNKAQYLLQNQVQYSLNNNPKIDNYTFALASYQYTQFGAFLNQTLFSIGYGRDWIKGSRYQFTTQIGPSWRHTTSQGTPTEKKQAINATTSITAVWNISKNFSFSETVSYTLGPPANYLNSTTALTSKIINNLAFSVSYNLQNWSKIPNNSDKKKRTDTGITANLMYSF